MGYQVSTRASNWRVHRVAQFPSRTRIGPFRLTLHICVQTRPGTWKWIRCSDLLLNDRTEPPNTLEYTVINHATVSSSRPSTPAAMTLPARLTWKDANGAVRFTSVRTREVTDTGALVECDAAVALPLYRLVHLQVEKSAREWVELPQPLRDGRVLSAVWQVAPCRPATGTPGGYALRFMTAPAMACETTAARRAS